MPQRNDNNDGPDAEKIGPIVHQVLTRVTALTTLLEQISHYFIPPARSSQVSTGNVESAISVAGEKLKEELRQILSLAELSDTEPIIHGQLRELLSEIEEDRPPVNATSIFRMRQHAVSTYDHLQRIRLKHFVRGEARAALLGCSRAARELERIASRYDLDRGGSLLAATEQDLLALLEELRGNSLADRADVHNLVDSVQTAVDDYRAAAEARGIAIEMKNHCHRAIVSISREGVRKAIGNLIDNAIKFTGELPPNSPHKSPWITITTRIAANVVSISVQSWGLPITREERENDLLFNYAFRGYFARGSTPGTGIGLNWVRAFSRRNGGDVTLETLVVEKSANPRTSTQTTFTLQFPLLGG